MQRMQLDQDIRPLSDFRAQASMFIKQVQTTRRPLVITSHGRSAAVLLDVREYDALVEKIELLQDVQTAELQLAEGKGTESEDARMMLLDRIAG